MNRTDLSQYLDQLLSVPNFSDYCPNGLQVEGRADVRKIVTAVSASVELFEKAIELEADTIIVHHGIIWNFERPVYRGGYKQRVKKLLENDINLFAYHLPLDAHPELGNAARIAGILNLSAVEPFAEYKSNLIGMKGRTSAGTGMDQLLRAVKAKINPEALSFPYGPEEIRSVGIVTGGGQKEVRQAIDSGLDLYLTGEASEFVLHLVKEERIHFIAAGHYATERFGIIALGGHIRSHFGLSVDFIDIPNPV